MLFKPGLVSNLSWSSQLLEITVEERTPCLFLSGFRNQGSSTQHNNSAFSFHEFSEAREPLDDQEAASALSFIELTVSSLRGSNSLPSAETR